MNDVSLTLKVAGGTGTAEEYKCQLSRAELVPAAAGGGGGAEIATFCDTFSTPGGNASWTLELEGFQQFLDAIDLARFLFEQEGKTLDYVLIPADTTTTPQPSFTGQVTASPTNIGGSANSYAQMTVSLQCKGKPTLVPPVVTAAGYESEYAA